MNNQIKLAVIFVTLVISQLNAIPTAGNHPLKNKALEFVDGMPGAMDGTTIAKLIHILKECEIMLYGERVDHNERIGRYTFNGKKHTLHTLARLERNKKIKKDELQKQQLKALLDTIKAEFAAIMDPFLEQARGAKSITLLLMEEWAETRNRIGSYLLTWGKQPDNSEFDLFDKEIDSFTALEQFCKDLISFIDDMINSCPRGWQQYNELKNKFHH